MSAWECALIHFDDLQERNLKLGTVDETTLAPCKLRVQEVVALLL